jgi:polyphosphate kinase 2 (PPK2 family)
MSDLDGDWVAGLVAPLRVRPGSKVSLPADFNPGALFGVRKKKDGARLLGQGVALLAGYQDRLAAQDTYAVLVVLQAMDAAGKDSTIKHVMSA